MAVRPLGAVRAPGGQGDQADRRPPGAGRSEDEVDAGGQHDPSGDQRHRDRVPGPWEPRRGDRRPAGAQGRRVLSDLGFEHGPGRRVQDSHEFHDGGATAIGHEGLGRLGQRVPEVAGGHEEREDRPDQRPPGQRDAETRGPVAPVGRLTGHLTGRHPERPGADNDRRHAGREVVGRRGQPVFEPLAQSPGEAGIDRRPPAGVAP